MFDVGETVRVPDTAFPVEKLVPVHDVEFVDVQDKVELLPEIMVEGETVSDAVGTGGGATVIVAELLALPPVPVQVTVYVVLVVGDTTREPATAFPVEKFVPVQDVEFVEVQVKVELPPYAIEEGEAEMLAVGTGGAATVNV